jgi:hypothetical protein
MTVIVTAEQLASLRARLEYSLAFAAEIRSEIRDRGDEGYYEDPVLTTLVEHAVIRAAEALDIIDAFHRRTDR